MIEPIMQHVFRTRMSSMLLFVIFLFARHSIFVWIGNFYAYVKGWRSQRVFFPIAATNVWNKLNLILNLLKLRNIKNDFKITTFWWCPQPPKSAQKSGLVAELGATFTRTDFEKGPISVENFIHTLSKWHCFGHTEVFWATSFWS